MNAAKSGSTSAAMPEPTNERGQGVLQVAARLDRRDFLLIGGLTLLSGVATVS